MGALRVDISVGSYIADPSQYRGHQKRRIPITGLSERPTALERSKTRYCLGVMTSAVVPFLPYFAELCRECLQPCLPASWLNSKLASAGVAAVCGSLVSVDDD